MILKKLKKILSENNETIASTNINDNKNLTAIYNLLTKISSKFEASLKQYLPTVKSVTTEKNVLIITGDFKNKTEALSSIKLALTAQLGNQGLNKYDIMPVVLPNKIKVTFIAK